MKSFLIYRGALAIFLSSITFSIQASEIPKPTANGIEFPVGYQDWAVVSVTHREDNKTLRAIVGNPAAIKAIEDGQTNPWPDGVALGKMVWKETNDAHWKTAVIPSEFVHAEFMFKDAKKWADTGGWGWARWLGMEQKPFGTDKVSAEASCVACHTPVKSQDWVFHMPAMMPKRISQ